MIIVRGGLKMALSVGLGGLFAFGGLGERTQPSPRRHSMEDSVIDVLFRLPEVRHANRFIDSLTHHKHGVTFLTEGRPIKSQHYYTMGVGYMHPHHYENFMTFYVWPATMMIKVEDPDPGGGGMITLAKWRKEGSLWHEW